MTLTRILWEEETERFVNFHDKSKVVNPIPLGFPTGFLL